MARRSGSAWLLSALALALLMDPTHAQDQAQAPVGLGYDPAWFRFGSGHPARLQASGPAPRQELAWPSTGAGSLACWAIGGFELRAERAQSSPGMLGLLNRPAQLQAWWGRGEGLEGFSAEVLAWAVSRRQGAPLPEPAEPARRPADGETEVRWSPLAAPAGLESPAAVPVLAGFLLQREPGQGGVRRLAVGLAPQGGWPAPEPAGEPGTAREGWPAGDWQWQAAFDGEPRRAGPQRLQAQALWLPAAMVARCGQRQGRWPGGAAPGPLIQLAPGTRLVLQGLQLRRSAALPLQAWFARYEPASGQLQLGIEGGPAGEAWDWALAWCELKPAA